MSTCYDGHMVNINNIAYIMQYGFYVFIRFSLFHGSQCSEQSCGSGCYQIQLQKLGSGSILDRTFKIQISSKLIFSFNYYRHLRDTNLVTLIFSSKYVDIAAFFVESGSRGVRFGSVSGYTTLILIVFNLVLLFYTNATFKNCLL